MLLEFKQTWSNTFNYSTILLKTFEHGQMLYVIFQQSAISNPSKMAAKVLVLSSKSSNQLFGQEGLRSVCW